MTRRPLVRGICLSVALYASGLSAQETPPQPRPPAAQGYLYIEPYHVRFETLFSLETVLKWLGIPFDAAAPLPLETQTQFVTRGREFGLDLAKLLADGMNVAGRLTTVAIVKGEPGKTEPLKEGDPVMVHECMAGLMWEFPVGVSPQQLQVQWRGLRDPVKILPVRSFFGTQSETHEIGELLNKLTWSNQGRLPPPKPLAEVPDLTLPATWTIPVGAVLWFLVGLVLFTYLRWHGRKVRQSFFFAWLLGAAIMLPILNIQIEDPFDKTALDAMTQERAQKIAEPLVENIYRAFDYQTEAQIYDALERSASGEFLRMIYLEISGALTLDTREGTKARVTDFALDVDAYHPGENHGFSVDSTWTARGTVLHWGHVHQRLNRYKARLFIAPENGEWKLTGMEVREARRM